MKYLIVGLGNVGNEYEGTRHNSGFMVLDRLLKACNTPDERPTYVLDRHAYRAEVKFKGRTLVLIRPTTYMNLSGKAVQFWLQKEKIDIANLLVVVDDIALPVGKIRMKKQGSNGGHNGLANIEQLLHTANYCRLRIGVGNNFGGTYVEGDLTTQNLYYYVGGQAVVATPIVTGNISRGHGTPTGVFSVRNKQTSTYLIGKDYRSYVNYWCPIIGNSIGIHDATWRGSFGGNIYKTNGSHGCINLPLAAMTQLFPILNVGTPVVVFY